MSLNKVMLIGNVGSDPEVRYLDGNSSNVGTTKVASFRLATTERYRDRNGELRENTEWHNVVAWRNSADLAEKFIHKGSQIYVEGKLRTRSWSDQSGAKRFTTEVVVDTIQLLGRKTDSSAAPQGGYGDSYPQPAQRPSAPAYQGGGSGYQGGASNQAPSYQGGGAGYQGSAPAYQGGGAPAPAAPAAPQQPISIDLDPVGNDDLPF